LAFNFFLVMAASNSGAVSTETAVPTMLIGPKGFIDQKRDRPRKEPAKTCFVAADARALENDQLLTELFSQCGPVSYVTIPVVKNADGVDERKGYAFVQFDDGPLYDGSRSVDYAIAALDGMLLFGRPLRVKRSTSAS
jgi:hypothetical protein